MVIACSAVLAIADGTTKAEPVQNPSHEVADNRTFTPFGDPTLTSRERDVKAAVHDGRGDGPKATWAEVFGGSDEVGGRVVDETGERAALPDREHHALDLLRVPNVADVGRDRMRRPEDGYLPGRRFQHLRTPAADVHERALGDERLTDLLAQPAAAAGHENRL